MAKPAVVMDNGTGYTKIGYSDEANVEPQFIFPTNICELTNNKVQKGALDDLDFHIGQEAVDQMAVAGDKYTMFSPVKHGIVQNWDQMEKLWQHSIYKYLRCEPSEHSFILTESPYNPPENREYAAEIMFETFGAWSLHIGVQAVLALAASWGTKRAREAGLKGRTLTGTVVDSGDGLTQVIPVYEGFVIQSQIKHIPLAGKDITKYIFDMVKEREKCHPDVNMMAECQEIKETYGSVCSDMAKEFAKYDKNPEKYVQKWSGVVPKTKASWEIDVGPEQFLAPELFFHPELFSLEHTTPLPELLDTMIQGCPIDTRRGLYQNIVLSGGSTMFHNFGKRLKRDVKARVDYRQSKLNKNTKGSGTDIPVNVITHANQGYAVWYGGNVIGQSEFFPNLIKTRAEYEEYGPSIFRKSMVGGGALD
eukprot:TRINITY_DN20818_c0_g1_i1.p1 TRINITY_DN20818_c0_g1~~TRINITY_DN20818_c0_g1_i1.p1  ORF type:complete len:421 (+),score=165.14 TRINITY_DN20818_c0_g1_i1:84-1346(+)